MKTANDALLVASKFENFSIRYLVVYNCRPVANVVAYYESYRHSAHFQMLSLKLASSLG